MYAEIVVVINVEWCSHRFVSLRRRSAVRVNIYKGVKKLKQPFRVVPN